MGRISGTRSRRWGSTGYPLAAGIALFLSASLSGAQQYQAIVLGGPYPETSVGLGIGQGQAVGLALTDSRYATIWDGSGSSINLNPQGFRGSIAYGTDGATQVGMVYGPPTGDYSHAAIWHGTAASFADLNPAGALASQASGLDGPSVVGQATFSAGVTHAMMWNTSTSSVVDLNPAGATYSAANAVAGNLQGGTAQFAGDYHAVLWRGSAQSWVDLTPGGGDGEVYGMSGSQQVGETGLFVGAALWNGTAQSYVNLNGSLQGSIAYATNGRQQVGEGNPAVNGIAQGYHALVWSGSSDYVDLSTFLPPAFANSTSIAMGIDANGDILGSANYTFEEFGQAILWVPVPEPACGMLLAASFCGMVLPRRR